ncbi:MAG: hypothetical protein LWX11_08785 [Firmicutes bacterium]|nr:hypothetical protein [Bacillota bacterium]
MAMKGRTCAALAAFSLALSAQDGDSRWKVGGFGTLGLAWSSTRDAEFIREPSQPRGTARRFDPNTDSRLGLQLNVRLSEHFSAVGQVVSRYRYDATYTPDLTWAFLNYAPMPELQIRLGRVGWDVFQLADTRNVGYSYLWVRPPVDFYGPLQVTCMDGGDVAWTESLGAQRTLRMKVAAGRASSVDQIGVAASGPRVTLAGTKIVGATVEYQQDTLNLRAAWALAEPTRNYPKPFSDLQEGMMAFAQMLHDPRLEAEAVNLNFRGTRFNYYSLGTTWEPSPVRVESALAMSHASSGPVPDMKMGYVSLGYRWGATVPYLMVSRLLSERPDIYVGNLPYLGPQGQALAQGYMEYRTGQRGEQTTWSAGCRWDFHSKMALKFQMDRVFAEPSARMLWRNVSPSWNGQATIASVMLDFVF